MSFLSFYRSFNVYLRERFGTKVYKVSLDGGFDCPNRDGTLAFGGCTYCDEGSKAPGVNSQLSIREQLLDGMMRMKKKYHAQKFIAYFQAYTNTYDRVDILRKRYFEALDHPDIVGLSIATRPDCVSQGAIELLEEVSKHPNFEVWLELGLQTIHDKTNEKLNRWHTYKQFEQILYKIKQSPHIKVCTNVILGLPGETLRDMHQTMDTISELPMDGVKLHVLHVIKNTQLAEQYERGEFRVFEEDEYIPLICDILEKLPPHWIIHRLTADAESTKLIAPKWVLEKGRVLTKIKKELEKRNTYQGIYFRNPPSPCQETSISIVKIPRISYP